MLFDQTAHKRLIRRINRYMRENRMSKYAFGMACANNSTLIQRLESGNVTARTIARIESFLEKEPA